MRSLSIGRGGGAGGAACLLLSLLIYCINVAPIQGKYKPPSKIVYDDDPCWFNSTFDIKIADDFNYNAGELVSIYIPTLPTFGCPPTFLTSLSIHPIYPCTYSKVSTGLYVIKASELFRISLFSFVPQQELSITAQKLISK